MGNTALPRDNVSVQHASQQAAAQKVARIIRRRRQSLGLTQEAVAFEAGVSVRHYQLLESGESNPRLSTLIAVVTALQGKLHDLLRKAGV